ncbi:MAG: SDR family NAD(P)-dependent oxidoreductase [Anaerolineae bacterium]
MLDPTLTNMGLAPEAMAGVVAVVTGAGGGIGREVAIALAQLGAAVAIATVDDSGTETERLIRSAGGRVLFRQVDLSEETQVAGFAHDVVEHLGLPLLLVNATAATPVAAVTDMPVATWDAAIAANLRVPFLICRAFLPGMIAAGRGTIINLVARDSFAFLSAYAAGGHGLIGFTLSLAQEVGQYGIGVVALAPGVVDTPEMRRTARDLAPLLGAASEQLLEGSLPAPQVAAAVVALALRPAGEYHGAVVDALAIIERAAMRPLPGEHVPPHEAPAPASRARQEAVQHTEALAQRLLEVITLVDAEFGRLPEPGRTIAHRGFREKTALSTVEWMRTLSDVIGHLGQVESVGATAVAALRAEHSRLEETLQALRRYFATVPDESVRFSHDEAGARAVAATSEQRQLVVRDLLHALHEVMA